MGNLNLMFILNFAPLMLHFEAITLGRVLDVNNLFLICYLVSSYLEECLPLHLSASRRSLERCRSRLQEIITISLTLKRCFFCTSAQYAC